MGTGYEVRNIRGHAAIRPPLRARATLDTMRGKRSAAAVKMIKALNDELADAGKRQGAALSWTVAEREALDILASTIDRRVRVAAMCAQSDDAKVVVKLSVELRQLDNTVVKILKTVNTEPPAAPTLTSIKARRAINTRWDRERARNAQASGT